MTQLRCTAVIGTGCFKCIYLVSNDMGPCMALWPGVVNLTKRLLSSAEPASLTSIGRSSIRRASDHAAPSCPIEAARSSEAPFPPGYELRRAAALQPARRRAWRGERKGLFI